MDVKIRFLLPFTDGNVLPTHMRINDVVTVSENKYSQLKNSGAELQVIERIIPKPAEVVEEVKVKTK